MYAIGIGNVIIVRQEPQEFDNICKKELAKTTYKYLIEKAADIKEKNLSRNKRK